MTRKPIHICLIQHSTRSDNLGVGALTVAEIEILNEIGREIGREIEITIAEWKDHRDPYVSGPNIKVVDMDRQMMLAPTGYFALARRADMVIDIGAGDSFADIYGTKRLRRMFWLKALTHLAGTPLVMGPQTIGPFTKSWSKRMARWTMKRSALVVTRDRLSTDAANRMGIRDVIEASDVAIRLPFDPPPPREPGGPVKVGINVSGLLMNGGYTRQNQFGLAMDYPALMRVLIRHFLDHPAGCEVHLVPHVVSLDPKRTHMEDDTTANTLLSKEFPEVVVAPRFVTPSEAKSYIAGLDFFMGARMHACIAAFSTGVPVVPMAYSRKFQGLFGTLGFGRTVDCLSETTETVAEKIIRAFEERDLLLKEIEKSNAKGLEKLEVYRDKLAELLAKMPG
ncbi:MAG: polysaccharide pyruvyl transferase family protein [Pseudooceanicola nanhaiensis]